MRTVPGGSESSTSALDLRLHLSEMGTRLIDQYDQHIPVEIGIPRAEARVEVEAVVDCVLGVLDGEDSSELVMRLRFPRLSVIVLRALRRDLIHTPPAGAEPEDLLETIRAVSTVLQSTGSSDPEDLDTRLMAPDAFELLVEVAHDLRSPLTSILFLAETLRGGHSGELNEVQRSQLGLVYSAALGLVSVVSDVMDMAKGGRGLLDPSPSPYSPCEVMRGVEELVGPMAEAKGVDLRLDLPDYDRAFGHPAALSRVLLNLTTNALKFTEQGFVEVGAKIRPHGRIEYYVRDTGRGMDPDREDLFQPFKKARSREGHFFSGSGLGLSMVRRLVRSMGSELELESRKDWGTRFSFSLPSTPGSGTCPPDSGVTAP